MSIRPVVFNGMLQNTNEVARNQTTEDNKGVNIQQQLTTTVEKEAEQKFNSVQTKDDAENSDTKWNEREGDGTGYKGNRRKKSEDDKIIKEENKDGTVFVKNVKSQSFDLKI